MKTVLNFGMAHAAIAFAAAEKSAAASGASAVPPVPAAGKPAAPVAAKPTKAAVTIAPIRSGLEMPKQVSKRGSKSKYDFDALEVGQSIGVIGRDAASLQSTVSSQNRNKKWQEQKRDEKTNELLFGKMKNAEGVEVNNPNAPIMENTRHFFVVDADPKTDPDQATARIWRDK